MTTAHPYPARLLRAGAGRRGDLLPAPSPDKISQSVARACASDTATGAAAAAKAPDSLLNCPGASASGALSRIHAGASGRNSHKPVSCGGTGCVLVSAAMCTHSTRAGRDSRLVRNGGSDEEAQTGQAAWPLHSFLSLDRRPRRRDLTRADAGFAFPSNRGVAPCAMQGDETPLRLSPLSGGCTHADGLFRGRYQCWCRGAECSHPSAAGGLHASGLGYPGRAHPEGSRSGAPRSTLTSSAMTADPRRADPGNLLAGAVSVLRRLSIMCNWPVALRGGGHIAGVA